MKTISGKLVSVQPISLSKASQNISNFACYENNGASEVVSIYLNRASEAFRSLVQLHKDLKHPHSSRKKDRRMSSSRKENAASLRDCEAMNCDDAGRKNRSRDENRGEIEDRRVGVIEDIGTTKKKRRVMHKKENVEIEGSISSELRKGSENGGNVEVDNVVNGFVDQTKKKKKNKNESTRESAKKEVSVDEERRGVENGIKQGKRKDEEKKMMKKKENKIKEV